MKRPLTILLAVMLAALGAAGCEDPLFPPNTPTSQFERYYNQRGHNVRQPNEPGTFGVTRQDLRKRLRPTDIN